MTDELGDLLKEWFEKTSAVYQEREVLAQAWQSVSPYRDTEILSFDPKRQFLTIAISPSSCQHNDIHFQKTALLEGINAYLAERQHKPIQALIFKPTFTKDQNN